MGALSPEAITKILDEPIMPPELWRAMVATHQDPRHTAYHEAGHAVVAHLQGATIEVVTIKPRDGWIGATFVTPRAGRYAGWQQAVQLWAGPVAEERATGLTFDTDTAAITPLLARLVRNPRERMGYSARARRRAEVLVVRHWAAVETIAACLLREKTLLGKYVHGWIDRAGARAPDNSP